MGTTPSKCILIAPLDWGLGHTTRCIPLIRRLTHAGHQVLLAGNDAQLTFLSPLFPAASLLELQGYSVQYSHRRRGMALMILRQIPRLAGVIRQEQAWLSRLVRERQIDGIISDNRYGLYHKHIPSVILTHQAQVLTGMGSAADAMVRKLHYRMLGKFSECWLVDVPDRPNLGGQLSHPPILPDHALYLGLLSQMEPAEGEQTVPEEHLLILLSGPEPQRSLLSRLLWRQLEQYPGKVVFVEGTEDAPRPERIPAHIRYFTRLAGTLLQPLMEAASLVVCRSGYSTLMDLCVLQKKAVLIPTPGQTEQEYLGRKLHREGIHLCFPQEDFSLEKALAEATDFPFHSLAPAGGHGMYRSILDHWVEGLKGREGP